ncbi:hemerythrin domain-containing protein [Pseudooceanicola sp.]|uniref:hemerythrin domain-containing protein n=1 Tax=Pseudooceanicola sp. TaxID=1914328 RepID=UPI00261839B0|nr:hemerythrin domain-containing protein [Pseudooceanicola sp.]MDF1856829.1 hemerythrin domain-containing protein [Pseudooceanicola sp.]
MMKGMGNRLRAGAEGHPIDLADFENPLDFLVEEHFRERSLCSVIDAVADTDAPEPVAMTQVLAFLDAELPTHIQDELTHVFPLLRLRCLAEDEIGPVIDAVVAEHDATTASVQALAGMLKRQLEDGSVWSEAERVRLHHFAAHVRRHVVLENAILLPIARARLSKVDLASLRRSMLEGRQTCAVGGDNAG